MQSNKIKVLIVDDSVMFRKVICEALQDHPLLEIVGQAANGKIALYKMQNQEVDLCILDLEMPEMDGIETMRNVKLMGLKTKVLMFSSESVSSANKTMEALELGALDFLLKPKADKTSSSPKEKISSILVPKIETLFYLPKIETVQVVKPKSNKIISKPKVLVIASSTGGPEALYHFFESFTASVDIPILITQHMPPVFTTSLSEKIGKICGKKSQEAVHGMVLNKNEVYVAPGNYHFSVKKEGNNLVAQLDQREIRNFVRPCADYLFETATELFGANTLGIVLTGMGRDGADGAKLIQKNLGTVLIQDQQSSVVFGMPGAVYKDGDYDYMDSPKKLAEYALNLIKR